MIVVEGLTKQFSVGLFRPQRFIAVEDVSFRIAGGETLGLCGESGCGKSTVGRCLVGLLKPTSGRILLNGEPLTAEKAAGRKFRRRMQIVFQDADGALDPRMKVQDLLLEPLRVHGLLNGKAKSAVIRLMNMVNLAPELMNRYPHELSGGQRQRINIARAVCLDPEFLVADEPTASLDLLVQAQMLNLLKRIQSERRLGCLLISHDLLSIRRTADRVAVMYMGRIVEIGKTEDVFNQPSHPYTRALIDAALIGRSSGRRRGRRTMLKGDLLDNHRPPKGCVFFRRCPRPQDVCSIDTPRERQVDLEHKVWCHQPGQGVSFFPNAIQATAP